MSRRKKKSDDSTIIFKSYLFFVFTGLNQPYFSITAFTYNLDLVIIIQWHGASSFKLCYLYKWWYKIIAFILSKKQVCTVSVNGLYMKILDVLPLEV